MALRTKIILIMITGLGWKNYCSQTRTCLIQKLIQKYPVHQNQQKPNKLSKEKKGHGHGVPAGNKASTAHLHFPFQNGSVPQCESYTRNKDGVGQPLEEEIEYFMDDPRKGACNFSDDTANIDSRLL